MKFSEKLQFLRKENKMSQEEFAEIFNVSRQTISSWENSKSYPDIETLVKLSDEFKISLDILLKGDNTLIKKYDEGYSHKELADMTGSSVAGCKMKLSRIVRKLKNIIIKKQ